MWQRQVLWHFGSLAGNPDSTQFPRFSILFHILWCEKHRNAIFSTQFVIAFLKGIMYNRSISSNANDKDTQRSTAWLQIWFLLSQIRCTTRTVSRWSGVLIVQPQHPLQTGTARQMRKVYHRAAWLFCNAMHHK